MVDKKDKSDSIRFSLFSVVFVIGFVVLVGRLFYWQVVKSRQLAVEARGQYQGGALLQAPRGSILANDASFLAANVAGWLVVAMPHDVDNTREVADKLSAYLVERGDGEEDGDYKQRVLSETDRINNLLRRDAKWVPIAHKVPQDKKNLIESLELSGIGFEQEEIRAYPEASSAAHLLGFVGKSEDGSDQGYFGLEGYYDQLLSGKPGYLSRESDALGVPILVGDSREVSAIEGVDILTHIDKRVQLTLEEELAKGIEKYGAKSGTITVMDPTTGAVLGMVSAPSYDPATYYKYGNEYFKNPAVSDSFEPGSIFKVLVMAAGLDADVVDIQTKCDICTGPYKVDKYTINTWDGTYRADSTMMDVIVHSDNVGMVFVANKLGISNMYKYLRLFGIGSKTGIDLQGESVPVLRKVEDWSIVDLAVASFGQGIAVTPIQMISAVAAIANDGVAVKPQVARKFLGEGWEERIDPVMGVRVISKEAAEKITTMMVAAAKDGESKWTHRRGFDVAGKTGTAQIPIAGLYDDEKTIASFVGFAPSDNPKFIMMVTLREPTSSPWSSETAAPLWYDIADDLFLYFGIQPEN